MIKVFAYGTLMDGFGNSLVSASKRSGFYAKKLGESSAHGVMYSLGGFPCVALNEDHLGTIVGEVFETDEEGLAWMDRLEGYPRFYNRTEIDTDFGKAWIYHIEQESYKNVLVPSGSWREYTGKVLHG